MDFSARAKLSTCEVLYMMVLDGVGIDATCNSRSVANGHNDVGACKHISTPCIDGIARYFYTRL